MSQVPLLCSTASFSLFVKISTGMFSYISSLVLVDIFFYLIRNTKILLFLYRTVIFYCCTPYCYIHCFYNVNSVLLLYCIFYFILCAIIIKSTIWLSTVWFEERVCQGTGTLMETREVALSSENVWLAGFINLGLRYLQPGGRDPASFWKPPLQHGTVVSIS